MQRIELARDVSPHLVRPSLMSRRGQVIPASAPELREIAERIMDILRSDPGSRMMAHVTPSRLAEVDHLIAIHVMAYEFNESNRPDADGDDWKWRVTTAAYTDQPVREWTTKLEFALQLMRKACPGLRISVKFGGRDSGKVRKAWFSKSHPTLPGHPVEIPAFPPAIGNCRAAGIAYIALVAAAMERETPI